MKLVDLFEAKYAGEAPTSHKVHRSYQTALNKYASTVEPPPEGQQPYSLTDPITMRVKNYYKYATEGEVVLLEIFFHRDSEERTNLKWIQKFANEHNLPYTGIHLIDDIGDDPDVDSNVLRGWNLEFDSDKF